MGLASAARLPGEHKLCAQFGVSRTVVRQELLELEHQGVIERVKGKGTFVAQQKVPKTIAYTLTGLYEVRFVDDEPWSWPSTTTYLPLNVGALVLHADLRDRPLYALFGEHGIRAKRGVRSAEATSATAKQAALLSMNPGQALLVLRSVS